MKELENQKKIKNEELEKLLKQKKADIQNLKKNNENLGSNLANLKLNLDIKENKIKEINNSLNK